MERRTQAAAIVLAGGGSRRMGSPKALLDWHGEPLVHRVARVLGEVCAPVVVVSAPGDALPLPAGAEPAVDAAPDRGPLEGVAAGVAALAGRSQAVFLAAVDLPLLGPELVRALVAALPGYDAVVPVAGGRDQPLAAAYTAGALARAPGLLDAGHTRALDLVEGVRVLRLDAAVLPGGEHALAGANTPEEYRRLLGR
jgi:molybdopterin-guanine dinucleotide biosynthesis protein A